MSPMRPFVAAAAAMLVGAIVAGDGPAAQERARRPIAILGATLIDGQGGAPLANSAIVVSGDGRIAAVGPRATVAVPPDAEVIEASGRFVIPGLIDGHVHYRSWLGEMFLNYGVTSVIDVGNVPEWMLALKEAIARGTATRMPNLYSTGWSLEAPPREGAAASQSVKRSATYRLPVASVEAARRQTATMIDDLGMDAVKVFQTVPMETLAAIAEEAHRRGRKVIGHTNDVYESVEHGLDAVAHMWGVAETTVSPEDLKAHLAGQIPSVYARMVPANADKLIAFMVAHKVYLNPLFIYEHFPNNERAAALNAETYAALGHPTLSYIPVDAKLGMLAHGDRVHHGSLRRLGNAPFLADLTDEQRREFREGWQRSRDFVAKFVKAGGTIWAGTDAGGASVVPGISMHHEVQLLVDAGMTPMQAIVSATRTPAELVGKLDEVGIVAPGRRADLVILEADPLRDIANTRRIQAVILRGEKVARGYTWNYAIPLTNPVETDNVTSDYHAVPRIERLAPLMASEGAGATTVTLDGAGFTTRTVVSFNGEAVPTQYKNASTVAAEIPPALLSRAGTWPVTAFNPRPGGGTSNVLGFIVRYRPAREAPTARR